MPLEKMDFSANNEAIQKKLGIGIGLTPERRVHNRELFNVQTEEDLPKDLASKYEEKPLGRVDYKTGEVFANGRVYVNEAAFIDGYNTIDPSTGQKTGVRTLTPEENSWALKNGFNNYINEETINEYHNADNTSRKKKFLSLLSQKEKDIYNANNDSRKIAEINVFYQPLLDETQPFFEGEALTNLFTDSGAMVGGKYRPMSVGEKLNSASQEVFGDNQTSAMMAASITAGVLTGGISIAGQAAVMSAMAMAAASLTDGGNYVESIATQKNLYREAAKLRKNGHEKEAQEIIDGLEDFNKNKDINKILDRARTLGIIKEGVLGSIGAGGIAGRGFANLTARGIAKNTGKQALKSVAKRAKATIPRRAAEGLAEGYTEGFADAVLENAIQNRSRQKMGEDIGLLDGSWEAGTAGGAMGGTMGAAFKVAMGRPGVNAQDAKYANLISEIDSIEKADTSTQGGYLLKKYMDEKGVDLQSAKQKVKMELTRRFNPTDAKNRQKIFSDIESNRVNEFTNEQAELKKTQIQTREKMGETAHFSKAKLGEYQSGDSSIESTIADINSGKYTDGEKKTILRDIYRKKKISNVDFNYLKENKLLPTLIKDLADLNSNLHYYMDDIGKVFGDAPRQDVSYAKPTKSTGSGEGFSITGKDITGLEQKTVFTKYGNPFEIPVEPATITQKWKDGVDAIVKKVSKKYDVSSKEKLDLAVNEKIRKITKGKQNLKEFEADFIEQGNDIRRVAEKLRAMKKEDAAKYLTDLERAEKGADVKEITPDKVDGVISRRENTSLSGGLTDFQKMYILANDRAVLDAHGFDKSRAFVNIIRKINGKEPLQGRKTISPTDIKKAKYKQRIEVSESVKELSRESKRLQRLNEGTKKEPGAKDKSVVKAIKEANGLIAEAKSDIYVKKIDEAEANLQKANEILTKVEQDIIDKKDSKVNAEADKIIDTDDRKIKKFEIKIERGKEKLLKLSSKTKARDFLSPKDAVNPASKKLSLNQQTGKIEVDTKAGKVDLKEFVETTKASTYKPKSPGELEDGGNVSAYYDVIAKYDKDLRYFEDAQSKVREWGLPPKEAKSIESLGKKITQAIEEDKIRAERIQDEIEINENRILEKKSEVEGLPFKSSPHPQDSYKVKQEIAINGATKSLELKEILDIVKNDKMLSKNLDGSEVNVVKLKEGKAGAIHSITDRARTRLSILISKGLGSAAEIKQTLRHEITHGIMEQLSKNEKKVFLDELRPGGHAFKTIAGDMKKRGFSPKQISELLYNANEVFAETGEAFISGRIDISPHTVIGRILSWLKEKYSRISRAFGGEYKSAKHILKDIATGELFLDKYLKTEKSFDMMLRETRELGKDYGFDTYAAGEKLSGLTEMFGKKVSEEMLSSAMADPKPLKDALDANETIRNIMSVRERVDLHNPGNKQHKDGYTKDTRWQKTSRGFLKHGSSTAVFLNHMADKYPAMRNVYDLIFGAANISDGFTGTLLNKLTQLSKLSNNEIKKLHRDGSIRTKQKGDFVAIKKSLDGAIEQMATQKQFDGESLLKTYKDIFHAEDVKKQLNKFISIDLHKAILKIYKDPTYNAQKRGVGMYLDSYSPNYKDLSKFVFPEVKLTGEKDLYASMGKSKETALVLRDIMGKNLDDLFAKNRHQLNKFQQNVLKANAFGALGFRSLARTIKVGAVLTKPTQIGFFSKHVNVAEAAAMAVKNDFKAIPYLRYFKLVGNKSETIDILHRAIDKASGREKEILSLIATNVQMKNIGDMKAMVLGDESVDSYMTKANSLAGKSKDLIVDIGMGSTALGNIHQQIANLLSGMDIAKKKGLKGSTADMFASQLSQGIVGNYKSWNKPGLANTFVGKLMTAFAGETLNQMSAQYSLAQRGLIVKALLPSALLYLGTFGAGGMTQDALQTLDILRYMLHNMGLASNRSMQKRVLSLLQDAFGEEMGLKFYAGFGAQAMGVADTSRQGVTPDTVKLFEAKFGSEAKAVTNLIPGTAGGVSMIYDTINLFRGKPMSKFGKTIKRAYTDPFGAVIGTVANKKDFESSDLKYTETYNTGIGTKTNNNSQLNDVKDSEGKITPQLIREKQRELVPQIREAVRARKNSSSPHRQRQYTAEIERLKKIVPYLKNQLKKQNKQ